MPPQAQDQGDELARRSRAELTIPVWADTLTRWLDDLFRIPGTRIGFGVDAILGLLLPGLGDLVSGTGSLALFLLAARSGVPKIVMLRMLVNVAVDALVGAVPIVGDLFDVAWKANRKNLELVRRHQTGPRRAQASDYLVVALAAVLVIVAVALPIVVVVALVRWLGS
jgi:hypothetical protein